MVGWPGDRDAGRPGHRAPGTGAYQPQARSVVGFGRGLLDPQRCLRLDSRSPQRGDGASGDGRQCEDRRHTQVGERVARARLVQHGGHQFPNPAGDDEPDSHSLSHEQHAAANGEPDRALDALEELVFALPFRVQYDIWDPILAPIWDTPYRRAGSRRRSRAYGGGDVRRKRPLS